MMIFFFDKMAKKSHFFSWTAYKTQFWAENAEIAKFLFFFFFFFFLNKALSLKVLTKKSAKKVSLGQKMTFLAAFGLNFKK